MVILLAVILIPYLTSASSNHNVELICHASETVKESVSFSFRCTLANHGPSILLLKDALTLEGPIEGTDGVRREISPRRIDNLLEYGEGKGSLSRFSIGHVESDLSDEQLSSLVRIRNRESINIQLNWVVPAEILSYVDTIETRMTLVFLPEDKVDYLRGRLGKNVDCLILNKIENPEILKSNSLELGTKLFSNSTGLISNECNEIISIWFHQAISNFVFLNPE